MTRLGKYEAGIIWVRHGHEVTQATPAHFPILFYRATDVNVDVVTAELDGSLPPSPATLKRFIGRIKVIEDLFNWLQNSDEPRTYLYGKGGSGKTTIAYEFATLLKSFGSETTLNGHDKPDAVIFLSAKEKMLQTHGGPIIADIECANGGPSPTKSRTVKSTRPGLSEAFSLARIPGAERAGRRHQVYRAPNAPRTPLCFSFSAAPTANS